jgi:hypothetical protein
MLLRNSQREVKHDDCIAASCVWSTAKTGIVQSRCISMATCAAFGWQVREEAGELCQTLEANEGKERAASEMADLLYHAMVLCNLQVRPTCAV